VAGGAGLVRHEAPSEVLQELKEEADATTEKLVDGLMSRFPVKNTFFTKILRALRPELPVRLAEDEALYAKARALETDYTLKPVWSEFTKRSLNRMFSFLFATSTGRPTTLQEGSKEAKSEAKGRVPMGARIRRGGYQLRAGRGVHRQHSQVPRTN